MARLYIHELTDGTVDPVPDDAPNGSPRRFGAFSVVHRTGRWPQVLDIWEYESWDDLAHGLAARLQHPEPPGRGTGCVLVGHETSPGVREWQQRGGTGAVGYVHETIDCPPGGAGEVCDTVVGDGAEDHRRFGLELVGAWRTAMRADDQVIALWCFSDWSQWAEYEAASDGGEVEFFHLWERLSGLVVTRRRALMVDAGPSPLRSGRPPAG